jgi:N-methylhydantoinase A
MRGVSEMGLDLAEVALFAHGTTIATNALITRRLPNIAMVTTRGFRDVIEMRRSDKEELWDVYDDVAPPYIRRRDRLGVPERTDYSGAVLEPLDEAAAREVARELRRRGVDGVAVCFINSFMNAANEIRMREILHDELGDLPISLSSDVLPEIFEFDRFSTTVINAMLAPIVSRYVRELDSGLSDAGCRGDLVILHSGGGVMTPRLAEQFASRLAGSGLAAGAIASRYIAEKSGFENAIGVDMGGTSTDISLCFGGEVATRGQWSVEFGYPICFPSVEVLTIGAGGGSIAWIDEAGSLRNGPQSAGADPGPACYGRGSELPTNSDANLVLGRLGTSLIGGGISIDLDRAIEAIRRHVAEPLNTSIEEAASAIVQVANANMANGVRLVSIRRGYDPRDFALIAFGGAGPLHAAAIASDLGIPTVVVPPSPGVLSAFGCLLVDMRQDFSRMVLRRADDWTYQEAEAAFHELEVTGRDRLRSEGIEDADIELIRSIDMRYWGQWRSLRVAVDRDVTSMEELLSLFHAQHEHVYNYRRDTAPVELYRLGVVAVGNTRKAQLEQRPESDAAAKPFATRAVWWEAIRGTDSTPVYNREALSPGSVFNGPAIVEQLDSTVVVPHGCTATTDVWGNLRIELGASA